MARRLTTNQEIAGSIPASVIFLFLFSIPLELKYSWLLFIFFYENNNEAFLILEFKYW